MVEKLPGIPSSFLFFSLSESPLTRVPRGGLDKTCLWFVVYTWEMMNGRKWRKKRLEECLAEGRGQEEDFSDPRYIHMDVDFCGDQFNRNPRIESTSIRFEA